MRVEVQKWGNSGAIRLPAALLRQLNVTLGDELDLKIEDGTIVLVPAHREYRLDDLIAGITKRNLHEPIDFGAPVGREAW